MNTQSAVSRRLVHRAPDLLVVSASGLRHMPSHPLGKRDDRATTCQVASETVQADHNYQQDRFERCSMPFGIVKWFNDERGFGFIAAEDGSPDLFVHYQGIVGTGHRLLEEGQRVSYTPAANPKGPTAIDVRVVDEGHAIVPACEPDRSLVAADRRGKPTRERRR